MKMLIKYVDVNKFIETQHFNNYQKWILIEESQKQKKSCK